MELFKKQGIKLTTEAGGLFIKVSIPPLTSSKPCDEICLIFYFPYPREGMFGVIPYSELGARTVTPPASQDKLGQMNCNALLGVNVAQAMGDK